jgi:hypothetical protein
MISCVVYLKSEKKRREEKKKKKFLKREKLTLRIKREKKKIKSFDWVRD